MTGVGRLSGKREVGSEVRGEWHLLRLCLSAAPPLRSLQATIETPSAGARPHMHCWREGALCICACLCMFCSFELCCCCTSVGTPCNSKLQLQVTLVGRSKTDTRMSA